MNDLPGKVEALLGRGGENAIHLRELCRRTGLSNRELRKVVERLRRDGSVICSDERGYYRPATVSELRGYIATETKRSKSIIATLKSARNELEKMEAVTEWQCGGCSRDKSCNHPGS